jgi:hypothetical protein
MVDENSAVLNLPFEVKIPATADHKKIAKHRYRDQRYHQIKSEVSSIVKKNSAIMKHRSVKQTHFLNHSLWQLTSADIHQTN